MKLRVLLATVALCVIDRFPWPMRTVLTFDGLGTTRPCQPSTAPT